MAPTTTRTATELEQNHPQIRRAVTTWDDCDIAALVHDGSDIGPITAGRDVVDITDFDASPYTLVQVNEREN